MGTSRANGGGGRRAAGGTGATATAARPAPVPASTFQARPAPVRGGRRISRQEFERATGVRTRRRGG